MELDEYKTILKIRGRKTTPEPPAAELEKVSRMRTGSVVSKIKGSLRIETAVALVFLVLACYVVIISDNAYLQVFCLAMLSFNVYFMYHLSGLYEQIQKLDTGASSVRIGLIRLIGIIRRFTALYFQVTMIMVPVILILGFFIGYLKGGIIADGHNSPFPIKEFRIYFAASVGWTVTMYFFTRWYIKKMYGVHLTSLSHHLAELQNGQ